eukprot:390652_1
MYQLQKDSKQREDKDFSNMLRYEIFLIFKNVNTLIIDTYNEGYSISMVGLLSLLQQRSLDKVVVKARGSNCWISLLWASEYSETLKREYHSGGYNISMKVGKYQQKHWFLITKIN